MERPSREKEEAYKPNTSHNNSETNPFMDLEKNIRQYRGENIVPHDDY